MEMGLVIWYLCVKLYIENYLDSSFQELKEILSTEH